MKKLTKENILVGFIGVATALAINEIGKRINRKRQEEELEFMINTSPVLQKMQQCNDRMEKLNQEMQSDLERHRDWLNQWRERNEAQ